MDAIREVKYLQELSHSNIIALHDVFSSKDQNLNLVLELAPEGELFNLIVTKQKLSEEETRHVFRQLFDGLKYLVSAWSGPDQIRSVLIQTSTA